jgi:hypothetical protein
MKSTIFRVVTLLIASTQFLFSQIHVTGTLDSGTVWTKQGSPYIVAAAILADNHLLTIEAGVEIQFQKVNSSLVLNGNVEFNGTTSDPISFNGAEARWGMVEILISEDQIIENVHFSDGGSFSLSAMVEVTINGDKKVTFRNCEFSNSQNSGTHALELLGTGEAEIRNCEFSSNAGNGLYSNLSNKVDVINSKFENNGNHAIYVRSETGLITGNTVIGNEHGIATENGKVRIENNMQNTVSLSRQHQTL